LFAVFLSSTGGTQSCRWRQHYDHHEHLSLR
jgi:hypothetical protein